MPQVLPWYCPITDQWFGSKDRYRKHVKAMAADRYDLRMRKKRFAEARAFISENITKVNSLEQLSEFIRENSRAFYLNGIGSGHNYLEGPRWRSKLARNFIYTEVKFSVKEVSGTRRVQDADEPCFLGNVTYHFEFDQDADHPMNPFAGTPIRTGSGSGTCASGSGRGVMRYEVALLAREWPALFVGEKLLA